MTEYMFGVDIGGTTVKIGLIEPKGKLLAKWEIPTNTADHGTSIVDDISSSIQAKLMEMEIEKEKIIGIGAGVAGFIDQHHGIVYESVNIGWENYPLGKELKERSGLPVFIGNDANVAALGERWKGAGQGADHMMVLTLGTGVGGGMIVNGEILAGANGMAGEIGHFTIEKDGGYLCNCGNHGCLETIASSTGIVKHAVESAKQHPDSKLTEMLAKQGSLNAKHVFELAEQGDGDASGIVSQAADALGYTIATIGIICNPQVVLIGGGVAKAGDFLLNQVKEAFQKYALPRVAQVCEIKLCKLGNDAGIFGGAYLVKKQKK